MLEKLQNFPIRAEEKADADRFAIDRNTFRFDRNGATEGARHFDIVVYIRGAQGEMEKRPGGGNIAISVRALSRRRREQFEVVSIAQVQKRDAPVAFAPLMRQRKAQALSVKGERFVEITGAKRDVMVSASGQFLIGRSGHASVLRLTPVNSCLREFSSHRFRRKA